MGKRDEYLQSRPHLKKHLGENLDLICVRTTGKFSITDYKYSSQNWNPLPKLYKNSPYLTLDDNVTDWTEYEAQPAKNENDEISLGGNKTITKTSDIVTLEKLPRKK